eukprot:TRINITY_DN7076_c0_g1_i1.p1 TRINITY_DN7076_c0_g1~~TRINITY_DN7076_c0_g1_i1.p1  ORF type:complete len:122 (+),score=38.40 TRINITY_DN7076_c0_g1_i1:92-457(+)
MCIRDSSRLTLVLIVAAALFSAVAAKSATASHILVPDEAKCLELKATIEAAADSNAAFADAAKAHSTCPSGKSGGSLGSFGPGQMVPEFDKVVFSDAIKTVLGPVKTQFGHHLIWISERTE